MTLTNLHVLKHKSNFKVFSSETTCDKKNKLLLKRFFT